MPAQKQSRFVAFITLFFFLGMTLAIAWFAFSLTARQADQSTQEVSPTPTPEPGTFNIDEQLDMLN